MTKTDFMTKVTRSFHMTGLKLKKHSPEILVVAGVIGTVASTVMACKATTKVSPILEEAKDNIDRINECGEKGEYVAEIVDNVPVMAPYSEEDHKKDLAISYAKIGLEIAKLYAPSVGLGVASLACILMSHKILSKRNAALATAFTAVTKDFNGYRSRLIERFGKELDRELKYNIKATEIEETVTDEDGNVSVVKKTVDAIDTVDSNIYSPYAIVFDDGNKGWNPDPELTKFFLVQTQNYANEKLKSQGYLFLNDVYKMLGAKPTKAGQVVGWIYDKTIPIGDNYVDFGIFDIYNAKARDFVNGYEKVIVLDFNVDGNILEYI